MVDTSEEKKEQPIIIKKVKGGHGGHHGGAWKVAYADFVTAMMAFFLVMWLVGQSDAVKEGVGGYFRDPVMFGRGSSGIIGSSGGGTKPLMISDREMIRRKIEEAVKQTLTELGEKLDQSIQANPEFRKFSDQIAIELTDEGLRIQLIESDDSPFFQSGSAQLAPFAVSLIKMIGGQLGKLPNSVMIEGHTDAARYADTATYTNWELSVDRANNARRIMLEGGLNPRQVVEVRGFADRRPRIKLNPADPRNRRITITVRNDYEIYRYSDTLFVDFNYTFGP